MEKKTFASPKILGSLAFALVLITAPFGGVTALVALIGMFLVASLAMKDEDASVAVLSAAILEIAKGVIRLALSSFEGTLVSSTNTLFGYGGAIRVFNIIFGVVGSILTLAFIALAVLSILAVSKGNYAGASVVGGLAARLLGIAVPQKQRPVYTPPVQPYAQPVQQAQPYAQPAPAAQPAQPVQPEQPAQKAQPAEWDCSSCGTKNTGSFCIKCGKAKQ